jgi:two-component system C4-dicarboxylate transport response regulator DctD
MSEDAKTIKGRIVVIDDDEAARVSIRQMLKLRGYTVEVFSSAEGALAWPEIGGTDCVITDIKMPGMDGERLLAEMKKRWPELPVIMITGHGDVSMAVRCLKGGAYDFVEKPFEDDVLLACVRRSVEKSMLRRESRELRKRLEMLSSDEMGRFGMIGRSRLMQDLYEQIEHIAKSDAPVLIIGETGVGKELVARAIHSESTCSDGPFVPVNAGALPESVLESELFGHTKGAFTGAEKSRDGKLVTASGGTLLLDEIEALSERAQVELLRVLEDGLVQPLGSDKTRKVSVRLLATTKIDLKELVKRGQMREDFYHRVMVLSIVVPPLCEHVEDIPVLVSHFLGEASERNGLPVPTVREQTLEEILRYSWPGNIRELKHAVERMVITAEDGVAGPFSHDEGFHAGRLLSLPATHGRLRGELERTEKDAIEAALREHGGRINETCEALGISRRALYERMKKYGFHKNDFGT